MSNFDRNVFRTLKKNTKINNTLIGTLHIKNVKGRTIEDSYQNYRNMFLKDMRCPFCLEKDLVPEQCVLVKIVFKRTVYGEKTPYFHRNMTRAHYSCVQGEMCYCNSIKNGICEFCHSNPELALITKAKKDNFFYTIELP